MVRSILWYSASKCSLIDFRSYGLLRNHKVQNNHTSGSPACTLAPSRIPLPNPLTTFPMFSSPAGTLISVFIASRMIITSSADSIVWPTRHLILQTEADIDEGICAQSQISLSSLDSTIRSTHGIFVNAVSNDLPALPPDASSSFWANHS